MYRTARPAIDMSTMPDRSCIFYDIGNYPSRDHDTRKYHLSFGGACRRDFRSPGHPLVAILDFSLAFQRRPLSVLTKTGNVSSSEAASRGKCRSVCFLSSSSRRSAERFRSPISFIAAARARFAFFLSRHPDYRVLCSLVNRPLRVQIDPVR